MGADKDASVSSRIQFGSGNRGADGDVINPQRSTHAAPIMIDEQLSVLFAKRPRRQAIEQLNDHQYIPRRAALGVVVGHDIHGL
jgi:hypothetical protein